MSIFASRTQQVLEMTLDKERQADGSPHTVTIQRIAGRHLQAASDADTWNTVAALKKLGGPAFQRELEALGDPAKVAEKIAEQSADPLNGLDRYVVLAKGIKAWTYPESLTPVEVTQDDGTKTMRILAIDDLDEPAADFLARAIATLSGRTGEARKNG